MQRPRSALINAAQRQARPLRRRRQARGPHRPQRGCAWMACGRHDGRDEKRIGAPLHRAPCFRQTVRRCCFDPRTIGPSVGAISAGKAPPRHHKKMPPHLHLAPHLVRQREPLRVRERVMAEDNRERRDGPRQLGHQPLNRRHAHRIGEERQSEGQRADARRCATQRPCSTREGDDTLTKLCHPHAMDLTDRISNLHAVRDRITAAANEAGRAPSEINLTAVSKTFGAEAIRPLLEAGHRVFGENRVQESQAKWPELRAAFPDLELRLIGPLQSNKAKEAVALFDVIETVDRPKIAGALAKEMQAQSRQLPVYIQINTGEEPQKAGIAPRDAADFIAACCEVHRLDVIGLMAIPPAHEPPAPHFALLAKIASAHGLKRLSMGMSADYEAAVSLGSTDVRVGSGIFGQRA